MLLEAGAPIGDVSVIGGGARSPLWGRILAAVLERPLVYRRGGEVGPAHGAARLARLAATGEDPDAVCVPRPVERVVEPEPALRDHYRAPLERFRALYGALREHFDASRGGSDA